jgi:hypothetical protein
VAVEETFAAGALSANHAIAKGRQRPSGRSGVRPTNWSARSTGRPTAGFARPEKVTLLSWIPKTKSPQIR